MSDQDSVEVIRRGYEAFMAGDGETMMNLVDDDVEWVQPGDSAISGTFHGKAQFGEYLQQLATKGVTVEVERLIGDGDTVVALTRVRVGDESGHDADVFTVRGGKIVRAEMHGDTALMERVFGKKELAAG
jgi:uncharacterized protein